MGDRAVILYLLTAAYCGITCPLLIFPAFAAERCEVAALAASWFLAVALAWATYLHLQNIGWIS